MSNHNYYYTLLGIRSIGLPPPGPPVVTTTVANILTGTTALSGGDVTSDGGSIVNTRGVVWSTSPGPTISLPTKTIDGSGSGPYDSNITGLLSSTTYYYRAYATNDIGTSYGLEYSFQAPSLPTVITTPATNITLISAVSGGNVTDDGGSPITARGLVWSNVTTSPVLGTHTSTSNGTGTGSFTSNMTSLISDSTYYYRAYAVNSIGISYGQTLSFETLAGAFIAFVTQPPLFVDRFDDLANNDDPSTAYLAGPNGKPTPPDASYTFHSGLNATGNSCYFSLGFFGGVLDTTGVFSQNVFMQQSNVGTAARPSPIPSVQSVALWWSTTPTWGGPFAGALVLSFVKFTGANTNIGTLLGKTAIAPTFYLNYTVYRGVVNLTVAENINIVNAPSKYVTVLSRSGTPVVATGNATSVVQTPIGPISFYGSVLSDEGSPVTSRGIILSTDQYATLSTPGIINIPAGSGTGNFTCVYSPSTLFSGYFRAYATNFSGTTYGDQNSFIMF